MFKNLSSEALGISGRQSEVIEVALSFGFKGIDLNVVEFADQVKTHGMPHARRLLDSAKLKLGTFALPVDWRNSDEAFRADMERLPALAAIAAEIGCQRAITFVEPACDSRPYHQNFEFHRQRFSEIAKKLQASGIKLGIGVVAVTDPKEDKAFEFVRSYDPLLMLLSVVGAANVGVVLDLWDLRVSGGSLELLRKLPREKIIAVQVADGPQGTPPESWQLKDRLLPGETGVIDTAAALTLLAELGYDGPITPAPHPSRFAGMRRDAIVKLTGEKLDQVWKGAGLNPAGKLSVAPAQR
jgi:sugar phosphate isomerase/epimerase